MSSSPDVSKKKVRKITLKLSPVGGAPILKKEFQKVTMDDAKTVGYLINVLRKKLSVPDTEPLYIFINQSFSPTPDVELGQLFDCFNCDNKLFVHYSYTVAWG